MKAETFVPDDYRPAENEPFMNDRQLEYFRRKLLTWKQDMLDQSAETIEGLQGSARAVPDIADRASEETDRALELRTRDRQRKLVSKIDAALRRIENGEFGYCEVTGEPISLKRLGCAPDRDHDAGSARKARTARTGSPRGLIAATQSVKTRQGRTCQGSGFALLEGPKDDFERYRISPCLGAGVAGLGRGHCFGAARRAGHACWNRPMRSAKSGRGCRSARTAPWSCARLGLEDALTSAASTRTQAVHLRDGYSGDTCCGWMWPSCVRTRPFTLMHRADLIELLRHGAEAAGVELATVATD